MGWVANKERNRKRENQTQCIIIIIDAAVYYYYYRKKERERERLVSGIPLSKCKVLSSQSVLLFSATVFFSLNASAFYEFSVFTNCATDITKYSTSKKKDLAVFPFLLYKFYNFYWYDMIVLHLITVW